MRSGDARREILHAIRTNLESSPPVQSSPSPERRGGQGVRTPEGRGGQEVRIKRFTEQLAAVGAQCTTVRSETEAAARSEEHTSELQSPDHLVCRLLLEKK